VLGVTGHQSEEIKEEFMTAGTDGVVTKPLKFDTLMSYMTERVHGVSSV
jgi:DNA-binding response OmpR family regulator